MLIFFFFFLTLPLTSGHAAKAPKVLQSAGCFCSCWDDLNENNAIGVLQAEEKMSDKSAEAQKLDGGQGV